MHATTQVITESEVVKIIHYLVQNTVYWQLQQITINTMKD